MEIKKNIGMAIRGMIKVKDVHAVSDQATNVPSKFKFNRVMVFAALTNLT